MNGVNRLEGVEINKKLTLKIPNLRIDIILSGSRFEKSNDGTKATFISKVANLAPFCDDEDFEGYYNIPKARFTFKCYVENFDYFTSVKWACVRSQLKELADEIIPFVEGDEISDSTESFDSAYGSKDLDFDASHAPLGPANDSPYNSNESIPSDIKYQIEVLRPEQTIYMW